MNVKRNGTTLIETSISIFLVAVVVVTFLEALNIGINGTLNLNRRTSALSLAKSQMEYVKAQTYSDSTGNLSSTYGVITEETDDIIDTVNYTISGQVANVSERESVQEITVTVDYLAGKQVNISSYKTAESSALSPPPPQGKLVTDTVEDMPFLPTGGFWMWGQWCGYYHVIETVSTGKISATWRFNWDRDVSCTASAGAPWVLIYGPDPAYPGENRAPHWVRRNSLGDVITDGFICRGGSLLCAGCPPNGDGKCIESQDGDYNAIAHNPTTFDCAGEGIVGLVICSSSLTCGEDNWFFKDNWEYCTQSPWWYDDNNCDNTCPGYIGCCRTDEYFEISVTTDSAVDPGVYTVLFFNGETTISFETISATVAYIH